MQDQRVFQAQTVNPGGEMVVCTAIDIVNTFETQ